MRSVETLRRRTKARLVRFRSILGRVLRRSPGDGDVWAAFVTIEGLNLWAEFARDYFRCALRHDATRSGQLLTTKFPRGTSLEKALRQIPSALRKNSGTELKRIHEPAWHSRRYFLKTVRLAGLSTVAQVEAAFALPVRFTKDLHVARNFFAHRNSETAAEVRRLGPRYSILRVRHPCDLILGTEPGRPVVVLEDWLAEVEMVVDHMSA